MVAMASSQVKGPQEVSDKDRQGKAKSAIDESAKAGGPSRPVGWSGVSNVDRKGRAKAVIQESVEEAQLSTPTIASDDCPSKGKGRAQSNISDYVMPMKGKGKEKARDVQDGVTGKGQRTQGRTADDKEVGPDLLGEAQGWSHQREPRAACGACSKSRTRSWVCPTLESAQTMEDSEQLTEEPCSRCSAKFTCVVSRNAACKMCNFHKVGCTFVNWEGPRHGQSVARKNEPESSKVQAKQSVWKHCQESATPPSMTMTTDDGDQSGDVSSPLPKRQRQRPSVADRQPSAGPSQPILVHPKPRTTEAVGASRPLSSK